MGAIVHDAAQHARRILSAVNQGARDVTRELVAHSWARCLNEYRLDPTKPRRPPVLSHAELAAHHDRVADVIDCARYEMTTLFQQLGEPESAVVLTDTDGVILHMVTSPEFERGVLPLGLRVGAVWSEAEAGTNGMGTCLVAASPVAVRLDEHFFADYTSLTCSAVPVHDPLGNITAVLDVSSRSTMSQQHLLVLLGMTARMIENRLIDVRYPHAHPIHFHSRPEFVYTLHEGKLIVDGDSRVLAANHSALFQLGVDSVREIRERRLDQIFQTTLDGILERSQRASYHPVVTYRANAAHRFFAVARLPAHDEAASARLRDAVGRSPRAVASDPPAAASAVSQVAAPIFVDPQLRNLLETACRVIAHGTPLLLHGETGAGKEIFARAVHEGSPRARGPFVAINCASLPESLIEAELFGYRAGAFTGAERRGRLGKIAQANGGTLFLDEIGDMPLGLQARLLRVLDERTVTPLGTDEPQSVEFQLISATHRQLARLVSDGEFREDLYYRLAGIEMAVPALRDRLDRADLIRAVLAEEDGGELPIDPAAWDLLMQHPWPGNVRQLRHVLRTAVALANSGVVTLEQLPSLRSASPPATREPAAAVPAADGPALSSEQMQERQTLLDLLEKQRWNVSHVAKDLQVSRNTLYRRMHKLRIPVTQGS
ncbi:MAG TPA: sigma-54-dependent Fis family transcriptional regulator [Burkholderiaceae bacterium]|nr:sigma-54-dependent Fis family transcriptional regulator [Burkholderiaceae bacterium]